MALIIAIASGVHGVSYTPGFAEWMAQGGPHFHLIKHRRKNYGLVPQGYCRVTTTLPVEWRFT
jgi:hypothetical protein